MNCGTKYRGTVVQKKSTIQIEKKSPATYSITIQNEIKIALLNPFKQLL